MTTFLLALSFAGGFALCWFAKDKILVAVKGAEAFITALEAKAAALKAALAACGSEAERTAARQRLSDLEQRIALRLEALRINGSL